MAKMDEYEFIRSQLCAAPLAFRRVTLCATRTHASTHACEEKSVALREGACEAFAIHKARRIGNEPVRAGAGGGTGGPDHGLRTITAVQRTQARTQTCTHA